MYTLEDIIKTNKTAFYVFDINVLKERIRYLKSKMPKNVSICYAIKANPFVVKEIDSDLEKFELCSPGEVEICKSVGIDSSKMVISGVYKTPEYIESLFKEEFKGVYTIESLTQYFLLCKLSQKYDKNIKVLIRLTNSSQFGVNEEDIEDIIKDLKTNEKVKCIGIQFFSGTQKTSIKKVRREIEHLDAFLIHLRDDLGFTSNYFEYGLGAPVSYFEGDDFDEPTYFNEFSEIINSMAYKTSIIIELGRSVVASCGKYYTHVVDLKCNKGINYALVDGGMHQIVYFGQQMAMKQPIMSIIGKEIKTDGKEWVICGALCSMNDIIVKQMPLGDIEIGDTLCFENAGAYSVMEGMALFLSRDIPAVYMKKENGEVICIRDTFETFELNKPKYKN